MLFLMQLLRQISYVAAESEVAEERIFMSSRHLISYIILYLHILNVPN